MTTAVQSTAVALAWNAVSDTGGSGLRDYRVYRDDTLLATVINSTSFSDATVTPNRLYSYQVSARDNADNEQQFVIDQLQLGDAVRSGFRAE